MNIRTNEDILRLQFAITATFSSIRRMKEERLQIHSDSVPKF